MEAEAIEGSEKLIKFQIDLGEKTPRQILAGLKLYYKPESLVGRQVVIVANLEPRVMMGLESNGMILAVGEEKPILLKPFSKVDPGAKAR